jgi:DNA primase
MVDGILLGLLQSVIGKGKATSKGNYAFVCPFHTSKPAGKFNLEINLIPTTDNKNRWHCWGCDRKGLTISSLFKALKVEGDKYKELNSILGTTYKTDRIENLKEVTLPKEFKPLFNISQKDLTARQALAYLKHRNITLIDILKYQIGYCESGRFSNKIIIPNYSATGKLNYFIARSFEEDPFKRFDAPSTDKNSIIGFESLINWNLPIILCEGPFDAIAIKRNAIPLYGKTLSKELTKKLLSNEVKNIYLALDSDALKSTLKIAGDILHSGKKLHVIKLDGKDPSDMGFEHFTELVQQSQEFTFSDLFSLKLATN